MSVRTSIFRAATAADRVSYPVLERSIQQWWDEHRVLQQYLHRNDHSDKEDVAVVQQCNAGGDREHGDTRLAGFNSRQGGRNRRHAGSRATSMMK